jgi:hypothetical protein
MATLRPKRQSPRWLILSSSDYSAAATRLAYVSRYHPMRSFRLNRRVSKICKKTSVATMFATAPVGVQGAVSIWITHASGLSDRHAVILC